MEIEINEILDEISVSYTDISTHWLLRECPTCSKKDKLRVDKETGKWICFTCYSNDESEGKGNLWNLLPKLGVQRHEIGKILGSSQTPIYTKDFDFRNMKMEMASEESIEPLEEITLPNHFMKLNFDESSYKRFPEAFDYLASRGVTNIKLVEKYRVKYSHTLKRIIFPFYDKNQRLVGWQGRDITDRWKKNHPRCQNPECKLKRLYYFYGETKAPESCPACQNPLQESFYPKTLTSYGFKKQSLLINQNLINPNHAVTLVEGPFDSINTPNSIPLLGKFLSKIQFDEIVKNYSRVLLYFDGDEEGAKATKAIYRQLEMFVPSIGIILNEEGQDPGLFCYKENLDKANFPMSLGQWAVEKKILV
jgi:hypothetical protein